MSSVIYSQSWIDEWQKSTFAFGVLDSVKVNNLANSNFQKYFRIVGTGALFYIKVDSTVIPTIVTAKHVFSQPEIGWNPNKINIRFSWDEHKSIYEYYGMPIELIKEKQILWLPHPDSTVDLACYPLIFGKYKIDIDKLPILPYSILATNEDIFQGARIYVLGYPGSVGKEFWNKAILREGIISWVSSSVPQKDKILIDCEVFPGNSGGPVFKIPTGIGRDGSFVVGGKVKFIGIVSERRFSQTPVEAGGKTVLDVAGKELYSLESIGIGVIEPVTRVRELLDNLKNELQKVLKANR